MSLASAQLAPTQSAAVESSGFYRVLLIDEQPAVRGGLRQLLRNERDLVVCGEADSLTGAMAWARDARVDVVIAGSTFPDGDAFELIRRLHAAQPSARVLVFSKHHESMSAERLIHAGAQGYIMKSAPTDEILRAIRRLAAGELYLSPALVDLFQGRFLQPGLYAKQRPECALDVLTRREFQIFQMSGRGMPRLEIAAALGVSAKTVESHRQGIRGKLGITQSGQFSRCAAECALHCRLERGATARCELDPRTRPLPGAPLPSLAPH